MDLLGVFFWFCFVFLKTFKQGREGIKFNSLGMGVVSEWYFLPYCIPVTLKHLTQFNALILFFCLAQFEFLSYVQTKDSQQRGTNFLLNITLLISPFWFNPH